jgi:hypothetical protein
VLDVGQLLQSYLASGMHGRKGLVCLYHTQLLVVRNQKVALCYYWAQVPLVMCAGFQVLPSDHNHGGPGRELVEIRGLRPLIGLVSPGTEP